MGKFLELELRGCKIKIYNYRQGTKKETIPANNDKYSAVFGLHNLLLNNSRPPKKIGTHIASDKIELACI